MFLEKKLKFFYFPIFWGFYHLIRGRIPIECKKSSAFCSNLTKMQKRLFFVFLSLFSPRTAAFLKAKISLLICKKQQKAKSQDSGSKNPSWLLKMNIIIYILRCYLSDRISSIPFFNRSSPSFTRRFWVARFILRKYLPHSPYSRPSESLSPASLSRRSQRSSELMPSLDASIHKR